MLSDWFEGFYLLRNVRKEDPCWVKNIFILLYIFSLLNIFIFVVKNVFIQLIFHTFQIPQPELWLKFFEKQIFVIWATLLNKIRHAVIGNFVRKLGECIRLEDFILIV